MKKIVTISRQYGSGGRMIGKKLAELLDVPFYDKKLITLAAEHSGFAEEIFEKAEEHASGALFNSLATMGNSYGFYDLSLNDKVFLIQSEVIRRVAKEGPCVIVGRCADYVLKEGFECVNVFIHAPIADRVKRAQDHYNLPPGKTSAELLKIDKRRANYYNYYSGYKWGSISNYHISLNSAGVGIDNAALLIRDYVEYACAST